MPADNHTDAIVANAFTTLTDFQDGVLLLFDKPLGWTSFDVVNKVRWMISRKLGVKRLKVGHAGTLDPLATGLLVLCTGKMTRQIQFLLDEDKGYSGRIRFGATTPSYDLETAVDQQFSTAALDAATIRAVARTFEPGYVQAPPMFSARKVDGQTAYKAARKGKTLDLPSREVSIHRFEITNVTLPDADFDVLCSKGTYIRSLAHDLGKALGNGAHLTELRRYQSGRFTLENALTIDAFEKLLNAV